MGEARSGRELKLLRDGDVIAGLRTKGFSINRNPVDISSDDDDGYRALLVDPGQIEIELSCDGVTKDSKLRSAAMSTEPTYEPMELEWPDGFKVEMDWFFASYEETGEYNEAITFSATFQGSGIPNITEASES